MSESTQAQLDALNLSVCQIQAQIAHLKDELALRDAVVPEIQSRVQEIRQVVLGMTLRSSACDEHGRPLIEMNLVTGEYSLRQKGR